MIAGTLEIQLLANMARLQADMDQAKKAVGGAMSSIERAASVAKGALIGLGAVGLAASLAGSIKAAIDQADALNKLTQRTGVAVEALSQLQYAAKLADVSSESLTNGIKKLNISIASGIAGDKEKIAVFKTLGVTLTDVTGKTKSADQVMLDIADSFSAARDGAGKTAAAVALLGKAGDEMIPFLNGGGDAIRALMKEADKLGLTIGSDIASQAEEFNDSLTRVQSSTQRLTIALAGDFVSGLGRAMKAMADAAIAGGALRGVIAGIQTLLTGDDLHKNNKAMVEQTEALLKAEQNLYKSRAIDAKMGGNKSLRTKGNEDEITAINAQLKTTISYRKILEEELDKSTAAATAMAKVRTSGREIKMPSGADEAQNKELAEQAKVMAALRGVTTDYMEQLTRLQAMRAKGNITQAEYIELVEAEIARQPMAKKFAEEQAQAAKSRAEEVDAYIDQAEKQDKVVNDQIKTGRLMHEQIEFETRLLGLNTEQRAIATAERELERQGIVKGTLAYEGYIEKIREAVINKGATEASIKEVDRINTEWRKFTDSIYNGLTDSLYRGFEAGKGFFKSFWDSIKNLFKTTVLKLAVQGVMTMTGLSGMFGAANAATGGMGGGGGITSMASAASAASSMYSAVTSGFAKIGASATSYFTQFATSGIGQSMGLSTATQFAGPTLGSSAGGYTANVMTQSASSMAASAGTFASAAAGAVAGFALGTMIAGDKIVLGMKGTTTSAIGAGIGLMLGGPIGAVIGGVIGGTVNAAFGMGPKKVSGSGISGSFSSSGANVQEFANWSQKGGWFRSNKSGTTNSAISGELQQALDVALALTTATTKAYASAIGLSASAVDGFTQAINISLQGLDAKGQQEAISAELGRFADGMAQTIIGTFTLVAAGVDQQITEAIMQYNMDGESLGYSMGVTRTVAGAPESRTYTPGQFARDGETASQTLARLAGSLTLVNATMGVLQSKLLDVSLIGAGAASSLLDIMGGVEKFTALTASYYDNFYSDEEKRLTTIKQINAATAGSGLDAATATRDSFRAIVEAQDLTTESGRNTYAALLNVAGAFAGITPAIEAAASTLETVAKAYTRLTTALKTNEQQAQTRIDLEGQLLQLTGTADQLRTAAIKGMDAYNIALYDSVQLAIKAQAVEQQRKGLQDQLNTLTDTSAEALTRQRDALDGSNRALFDSIQRVIAAKQAYEDSKTATNAALDAVKRAIDAEKTRIGVIQTAAQESVNSIKGVFTLLRDQIEQLYGTVDGTQAMQARDGNAFIDNALANMQSTGYLPDQEQLAKAIAAARGGLDANQFATQFEADKAALVMAGKLSQISAIAGPQLTIAEQALQTAKDQLTALDAQMTLAQQQVDTLNGINTSVLSVRDAMTGLASAIGAQATARAAAAVPAAAAATKAVAPASQPYSVNDSPVERMAKVQSQTGVTIGAGDSPIVAAAKALYQSINGGASTAQYNAAAAGVGGDIASAVGWDGSREGAEALRAKYGFAVGTNYVPRDMMAQIHEGEAIVPKAYNPAAGGGANNDRLERLVEGLTAEVQRLQSIVATGNQNTRRTADAVNGNPEVPMLVQTV